MTKVDMPEILTIQDRFESDSAQLKLAVNDVKSKLKALQEMESFEGSVAESTKAYFEDVPIKSVDLLIEAINSVEVAFRKDVDKFCAQVDDSTIAKIDQDYLIYCQEKKMLFMNQLASLSSSVNGIISSIDDVSGSKPPSFSSIEDNYFTMSYEYNDLFNGMGEFRSSNLTDALEKLALVKQKVEQAMLQDYAAFGGLGSGYFKDNPVLAVKAANAISPKPGLGDFTKVALLTVGNGALVKAIGDSGLTPDEIKKSVIEDLGTNINKYHADIAGIAGGAVTDFIENYEENGGDLEDTMIDTSVEAIATLIISGLIDWLRLFKTAGDEITIGVAMVIGLLTEMIMNIADEIEGFFGEGFIEDIQTIANEIWNAIEGWDRLDRN